MPFSAACPSCGAPVDFKSTASFHAVCGFCRSTLVRHGADLENLGRMADLLVDASPLQLGSEGRYKGVHFALIGRIQLKYEAGLWNEWHILFDDQRGAWLSDANGEYVLTYLTPPSTTIPPYAELPLDQSIQLASRDWVVTNREEALCIAGEGELPFAFGAGYPAELIDLRTTDDSGGFASIDYSETTPLLFIGETVNFAELNLTNLRQGTPTRSAGPVKALACPQCGSAITLHDQSIQRVACPSCLSLLDANNESLKVLKRVQESERVLPLIPIGSVARFGNQEWTVIGFQQRVISAEGVDYPWQEYLLHHPTAGFRWLVEAERHWNWVTPLSKPPSYSNGMPSVRHDGDTFVRFSSGEAKTTFVLGEFNWKVKLGETWDTVDFVAPPRMLSRESGNSETTWSLGEYLTREELTAALNLPGALPEPSGIGANQPNPRRQSHAPVFRRFWQFALLAIVLQLLWVIVGGRTLVEQKVVYSQDKEEAITTPSFHLDQSTRSLALRHDTDLSNNWVGLNIALVDQATGRAWTTSTELSYWHGVDGGESWSEGDKSRELVFRDVPAGDYYLVIDPEMSDENRAAVADTVRVVRNPTPWSNFFFLLVFLLVFPLITRYRIAAFETARWANADYDQNGLIPSVDDSSGDDD
jgi:hypothetical protein